MLTEGTIKAVRLDKGFGFIQEKGSLDRKQVFFHVNDLPPTLEFDERLVERRVSFIKTTTDKGTRARDVHPLD